MSVDWLAMEEYATQIGDLADTINPKDIPARRQALAEQHLNSINNRAVIRSQDQTYNRQLRRSALQHRIAAHQHNAQLKHQALVQRTGAQNQNFAIKQQTLAQRSANQQANLSHRQQVLATRQGMAAQSQANRQQSRVAQQQAYQQRTFEKLGNSAIALFARRTHARIATLPAPGGLGAVVIAILLLLVFIIPTNGKKETRAQLVYDVALGQRDLPLPTQLPGHDTIHIKGLDPTIPGIPGVGGIIGGLGGIVGGLGNVAGAVGGITPIIAQAAGLSDVVGNNPQASIDPFGYLGQGFIPQIPLA